VKRRRFVWSVLPALAAAFSTSNAAQGSSPARVGWLAGSAGPLPTPAYLEALRQGMRERGWVEGRNLVVDIRWGDRPSAARLTEELLGLRPQVLVAQGAMVLGARDSRGDVPIVFGFSGDPVEARLVTSFARPGGRLTGIAMQSLELVGKRLEILKEIMPRLSRVAIVANPAHPGEQLELRASNSAAAPLGISTQYLPVSSASDFERAFPAILRERAQAIVAFPDALIMSQARQIAEFSRANRIPAVSGWSEFADEGNLLTYGPNLSLTWNQAASFVDRILRGARPADLPVEQPSSFELVINQRAAEALGISIPKLVSARAERFVR
jgi:putative tryptophan/tyrosine transport system substrate-binding protein